MEIDLPKLRELVPSLRFAATWVVLSGLFMSSISLLLLRAKNIEIIQET